MDSSSAGPEAASWWQGVTLAIGERRLNWGDGQDVPAEMQARPMPFSISWHARDEGGYWRNLGLQLQLPPNVEELLPGEGGQGGAGQYDSSLEMYEAGAYPQRRLVASLRWQQQFAARKHSGETLLTLTLNGAPVEGAHYLLNFLLNPSDQALFDAMLADLQAQQPAAPYSLEEEVVTGSRGPGVLPDRLGARWAALQKAHKQLEKALPPVLASPQSALSYSRETVEWSTQLARHNLAGATPSPGTVWRPTPGGSTLLPQRMTLRRAQARYDIPANRYVRATVDLLVRELHNLEHEANLRVEELRRIERQYTGTHHWWHLRWERALARYGRIGRAAPSLRARCIEDWLQGTFLGGVPPAQPHATDLLWRDNIYYRRIRSTRKSLLQELQEAESTLSSDVISPTPSINGLYELWLAMTLLQALCMPPISSRLVKKGNSPVATREGAEAGPNYLLNRRSSAELRTPSGKRLILRFDMPYPFLEGRPLAYGVDRALGSKNKPDLALEIWDDTLQSPVPRIVVLDATWSFSQENQAAKFLYRESIRDFTRQEASGKPGRPVISAWVVYPGAPHTVDYEEDYRTGHLPLAPGREAGTFLAFYVEKILRSAGALGE